MAAWPIRFLTGARPGKRPHAHSWTIGLAQDAEIPDLMKFLRSGPTEPTILVKTG
jgi:hypothetical protein